MQHRRALRIMDYEEQCEYWDAMFGEQRDRAFAFMKRHNSALPTKACPACGKLRHVPGLPCPQCGYRHIIALGRLRDTEWGYEVIGLGFGTSVFAKFEVEDEEEPD